MKVKTYKDKYGYMRADCPFCGEFAYVAKGGSRQDELRNLKRHITNAAKNEALEVCTTKDKALLTPHLTYYKEHTTEKKVVIKDKRQFDNDLTV